MQSLHIWRQEVDVSYWPVKGHLQYLSSIIYVSAVGMNWAEENPVAISISVSPITPQPAEE